MFDELRTFILFAEEGSIQRVAQRIPLTQPAVSRQIQRLEQTLGIQLLDRRQKPSTLTPMGKEVLSRGKEVLESFEKLKAIAAPPEPEGVFRLGLANGLAHEGLAESFAAVISQFPRVSLRLKSGWSDELAEQHKRGRLDAAIVLSDTACFHDAEQIGEEELIVVGSSDLATGAEENAQLGWILSPEPCDARRCLTGKLAQNKQSLIIAAEIEHAGLQMGLIRQGLGLGLMPKRFLDQIKLYGLKEIDVGIGNLHLGILILRSPHPSAMSKVENAIADRTRGFITK
ncbi:LysR family transcriptional regulator [Bordetella tumulicola]|uniref:LysR family transcriptional regulator n=1 Tax=Bordetella tumulicola TaxID=1649133 RepID=UPI0039EFFEE7